MELHSAIWCGVVRCAVLTCQVDAEGPAGEDVCLFKATDLGKRVHAWLLVRDLMFSAGFFLVDYVAGFLRACE